MLNVFVPTKNLSNWAFRQLLSELGSVRFIKTMKKKNKILKLWKTGMSKRAIGIKVGVQRSYVQKIIKQSTI